MSAAPSRLKQAHAPSGGSEGHEVPSVGALTNAAPSRLKQAHAPSGGSEGHAVPSVGALTNDPTIASRLEAGVNALGLDLSEAQRTQLLDYLALIQKWNKVYNLTAVRDPQEMLSHHLLDSLAVVAPLRRHLATLPGGDDRAGQGGSPGAATVMPRLLDVGSGAGLPGVVLAICCPQLAVDCVDTVGKKAAFIQQAAVALKLPNLRGLHDRVERLTGPYDVVCSRAFASLVDFVTWSAGGLSAGGAWMAMKGKHPAEEMAVLPSGVAVFHVEPLTVPGLDAERCIVWLKKTEALT